MATLRIITNALLASTKLLTHFPNRCMIWNETEAERGANEIRTCMTTYLSSLLQVINHVTLYSDNCGDQNKNKFFAAAMISSAHIDMIDHKFFERGHTHMEVDSIHVAMKYAKKSIPVFLPSNWETVCRLARKHKRAYSVLCLSQKRFN